MINILDTPQEALGNHIRHKFWESIGKAHTVRAKKIRDRVILIKLVFQEETINIVRQWRFPKGII